MNEQKSKKEAAFSITSSLYGSGGKDRTYDQLINSQLNISYIIYGIF